MRSVFTACLCLFIISSYAQVGIKADNTAPISSAQLELQSTTRAFYPPRMTNTQMKAITDPRIGAVVYNTDLACLSVYNGVRWECNGAGMGGSSSLYEEAQGPFEVSKFNSIERVQPVATATNTQAVLFMTGYISEQAELFNLDGTSAMTTTVSGGTDAYTTSLSSNGEVLWTARVAGLSDDQPLDICADATGATVIVKITGPQVTIFNGRTPNQTTETSWGNIPSGTADHAIIRYGLDGQVRWVARITSTTMGTEAGIGSDENFVYAYTASTTQQLTVFNGRSLVASTETAWGGLTAAGSRVGALVKYNISTGAVQWVARVDGSSLNADDLAVNKASSNVLYTSSTSNLNFIAANARTSAAAAEVVWGTVPSLGSSDSYLVQYSLSTGAVNWVARQGSSGSENAIAITSDVSGNVYSNITGQSTSSSLFQAYQARTTVAAAETSWGSLPVTSVIMSPLMKYNKAGTIAWMAHATGFSISGISVDNDGCVYAACFYNTQSPELFHGRTDPERGINLYKSLPSIDGSVTTGVLMKYSQQGNIQWINKTKASRQSNFYQSLSVFYAPGATLPSLFGMGGYFVRMTLGGQIVNSGNFLFNTFYFKYSATE